MSLKSLINDPQFKELPPEEQKRAVVALEPEAAKLPESEYQRFTSALQTGTVQQAAGEVPTKEYFKSVGRGALKGATLRELTPEEHETPGMGFGEMVGSAVPMAISEAVVPGSPMVTPAVKAGLAGMVYGASKGAVNRKPIPQQLKDIAASSLGFMGAQRLGQLFSKFFKPVNPATLITQQAVQIAEKEGIKPLPSMISESKAVAGGEKALEYSPFGSQITAARQKAVEEFGNYAQRVGESISPKKDPEVNGSLIKEAAKGFYDTFNNVKNKLYDSFLPQIGNNSVEPKSTLAVLKEMIGTAKNRGEEGIASYAASVLNKIKPESLRKGYPGTYIASKEAVIKEANPVLLESEEIIRPSTPGKFIGGWEPELARVSNSEEVPGMLYPFPEKPSFAKLKDIGTGVGTRTKFHDPSNPGMQGQMKKLWGAIQNDLDNAVEKYGDESIKDALAKAKEYNHIGKTILESKTYDALLNAPQGMEYKIAFNRNDPMAYEGVKEIVGPELMGGMARQWFNDLFTQATKNKITSPQLLLNKLDKVQSLIEKMADDFPEAVGQIEKLKLVASMLSKNADVMKGSQTFAAGSLMAVLGGMGASIANLFVNPKVGLAGLATGAGVLGASKAGASFYTSEAARKLFTKGMGTFPKARLLVGRAAELGTRLGVAPLTNENQ